jgi:hypothetical protein
VVQKSRFAPTSGILESPGEFSERNQVQIGRRNCPYYNARAGTMNSILGSFNPETQRVLDIANVAIFALALFGLIITLFTLKREKRRDRETTEAATKRERSSFARKLYVDYLKVALANPDLSIAEYNKDDELACDKYDTFVSIMLYSFDEMINVGEPQIAEMIPTID